MPKKSNFYEIQRRADTRKKAAFESLVAHRKDENEKLKQASKKFSSNDKLTSFLYDLMRDHVTPGVVAQLMADAQEVPTHFSNGWLARYAKHVASRLK